MQSPDDAGTKRFVLRETLASEQLGKPIWFCQMTGIGPPSVPSFVRARAPSSARRCFMRSPFYEVEEVEAHAACS